MEIRRGVIILFGAGVYAKKYKALLEYLDLDFDYFTDNDSSKWGAFLYGKEVISPDKLSAFTELKIIISSTHEAAICRQLSDMGMSENIIGLDTLYDLCEQKLSEKSDSGMLYTYDKTTIAIDMYEGIGWGGTELWAADLAYGLRKTGSRVLLLGGVQQPKLDEKYEDMVIRISENATILQMAELMENSLPCIFINNFAGCAFMAAVIMKKKYPDLVKIVSVIHNDNKSLFDAHMMLSEYIDRIFCVSAQIEEHMRGIYDFDALRYYFKEQPVKAETACKDGDNCISDALRIGYAARLVKQQKRADLLIDLISLLEKHSLNYLFRIAGEGECFELIEKYITENNLQSKVQLIGRLPKSEMNSFWEKQDVFVNVSEYEGTSLSMLEAMAHGCVPVVTNVSGAGEFIEPGENGYICEVGDIEGIAGSVVELSKNRELVQIYGEKCRKIVSKRCNPEEYITYWKEKVLRDWI